MTKRISARPEPSPEDAATVQMSGFNSDGHYTSNIRMHSNRAHLVWMLTRGALLGQKCQAYRPEVQNGWEVVAQPDGVSVEVTYVSVNPELTSQSRHRQQVDRYRKALEQRDFRVQPINEGTPWYKLAVWIPDAWCDGITFEEQADAAPVQP